MQEFQEFPIEETDAQTDRHSSLGLNRLLVLALVLCAGGCLAAIWLSGILLSAPDHLLPASFLQLIARHRPLTLLAPAICLGICYWRLRTLTGEIITLPERYLDERQQMLRDQAHRSAFKIIKLACVLIPLGFLVTHLPWFQTTPSPPNPHGLSLSFGMIDNSDIIYTAHSFQGNWQVITVNEILLRPAPVSNIEIILACSLLLLSAWLLLSALPMCVLAWKGKR